MSGDDDDVIIISSPAPAASGPLPGLSLVPCPYDGCGQWLALDELVSHEMLHELQDEEEQDAARAVQDISDSEIRALALQEAQDFEKLQAKYGFSRKRPGRCHKCGQEGHWQVGGGRGGRRVTGRWGEGAGEAGGSLAGGGREGGRESRRGTGRWRKGEVGGVPPPRFALPLPPSSPRSFSSSPPAFPVLPPPPHTHPPAPPSSARPTLPHQADCPLGPSLAAGAPLSTDPTQLTTQQRPELTTQQRPELTTQQRPELITQQRPELPGPAAAAAAAAPAGAAAPSAAASGLHSKDGGGNRQQASASHAPAVPLHLAVRSALEAQAHMDPGYQVGGWGAHVPWLGFKGCTWTPGIRWGGGGVDGGGTWTLVGTQGGAWCRKEGGGATVPGCEFVLWRGGGRGVKHVSSVSAFRQTYIR